MRLSLAAIPAAIITLLLFLIMQALIGAPDRRLVQRPEGTAVAFLDLAGLLRADAKRSATPSDLAAAPVLDALPPLPDPMARGAPRPSPVVPDLTAPQRQTAIPEVPLDLGGLTLPPRPGGPPPRPVTRPVARAAAPAPVPPPATAMAKAREVSSRGASPAGKTERLGDKIAVPAGRQGDAAGRAGGGGQGTDSEARPLVRVEPDYPRKAARAGQEGWVKLAFTITPSGSVKDVVVVDSQPRRVFERSARRALEQWRFQPQLLNGQPVPRQATQVIEFKLAGRG